jgi:hypothetical protein
MGQWVWRVGREVVTLWRQSMEGLNGRTGKVGEQTSLRLELVAGCGGR